jgi:two-component system, OmpR family, sensor histidine kinase ChvG
MDVPFHRSVRARFLLISAVLLLVPLVGVLFVREMALYLRAGQQQVAVSAARLVAASISDRPEIDLRSLSAAGGNSAEKTDAEREREQIIAQFAASDAHVAATLGNRYQPDTSVERILNQSGMPYARVWVVDASGQVRGLVGSVNPVSSTAQVTEQRGAAGNSLTWPDPITRNVMSLLLPPIKDLTIEQDSIGLVLAQAARATIGEPTVEWRNLPEKHTLMSAAAPVWQQENIVAAVVIEETDHHYRNLAKAAAETVMMMTLIVFVVVFGVLAAFAWQFTRRLTRLQRDANRAIDANGRVRGALPPAGTRDEIGALSETLRLMVARQSAYNNYLEQLAARLSHELRTPVAVVRSSLDNLRAMPMNDDSSVYLARADEGINRLSQIIARMSEATRLEKMLQGAVAERIDVASLLQSAAEGYRQIYPASSFELTGVQHEVPAMLVADAIVQMLDKLVANAVDFAKAGTAIRITLVGDTKEIAISVENKGALLPDTEQARVAMFDSMVTAREVESEDAHLGLGLYIARLVAEHHGGDISAENLADASGVIFTVTLPTGLNMQLFRSATVPN